MVTGYTCTVEEVLPIGIGSIVLIAELVGELARSLAHLDIAGSVHHRVLDGLLETHIIVESHFRGLSHNTFISGDEYNAVGTAGTVDGGRGSIFQDIHALDVARSNVRKGTHEGNTVKDDERIVVGREGTLTTDADLHARTRLGVRLGHLDTGDTAIEGTGEIAACKFAEIITAQRGDGTRDVSLAG